MIHKIIKLQNIIFLVALHVDRYCCRFIVVKLVLLFTSVHKSTNPTYAGTHSQNINMLEHFLPSFLHLPFRITLPFTSIR